LSLQVETLTRPITVGVDAMSVVAAHLLKLIKEGIVSYNILFATLNGRTDESVRLAHSKPGVDWTTFCRRADFLGGCQMEGVLGIAGFFLLALVVGGGLGRLFGERKPPEPPWRGGGDGSCH
jgi:hypothetical protein